MNFSLEPAANRRILKRRRVEVMKMRIILAGLVALGLFASQTDVQAHGGGGGGFGGGGRGGGGGGRFYGGGHFYGRGYGRYGYGHGYYYRGRYYWWGGPGWGFYGYPWWPGWWDYSGYYYPGPYYGYGYGDGGGYYASSDPPSNSNNSSYQFNSTRAVQAALAWRGFYNGRIDGVMGPETRSAIRAFQRQQGLPETGEIDSNLTKALQRNR
jgi:Putative peptidoglycan binding domain